MIRDERWHISLGQETVPALVLQPGNSSRGTVLVYHGLGADKEVQRKEMNWLAEAEFTAVGIDAPHHGARRSALLDSLPSHSDPHGVVIQMIREAIAEIPALVEACRGRFSGEIGITGISLGGFIAYGAVIVDKRLGAAVPILGSPDWRPRNGPPIVDPSAGMDSSPMNHPDHFYPCALFASNAALDIHVPAAASRTFIASLEPYYRKAPERLRYLEYAQSGHMMREEDWSDLWRRVIEWFELFLAPDQEGGTGPGHYGLRR